jgi:hypothetical protein
VDVIGHVFGRGVDALEGRVVVEVAVVDRRQHPAQLDLGQADVHQQLVCIELWRAEFGLHREGGAVQALGRSELLALEAVGDHDVVADGQTEHKPAP